MIEREQTVRALSFVDLRSFLASRAIAALLVLAAPSALAVPSVVVVEIAPGPLGADRVRAAVGRELGMTAVAPADPRARSASGRVTVAAHTESNELTVTFVRTGGAQRIVSRTTVLPKEPLRAESAAVILAGNVARDEAGDVLRGLKKGAAASPNALPPPSADQVAALGALKDEVSAYEKGAKDYRETVSTIVRLHYETKKREVLAGLDRELAIEKVELRKARDVAIERLEQFVGRYAASGPPEAAIEAVPDAMYRLAALYEERARGEDAKVPLSAGLADAIRVYRRIARAHPGYREIAGVFYFLGHALNDAGRVPEAQQVWRSLVCHDRYPYPTAPDPTDPSKDAVAPMAQDADERRWTAWRHRYDSPRLVSHDNPETTYTEVYPDDCKPLPQPSLRRGEEPRYVAEVWWQIGNWEFDQLDFASGVTKESPSAVWGYNRAASAYRHGMQSKRAPLFGVTLYKYAWTLFKQQRYELATRELVKLLEYTDEQEKITGDRGADFRSEAYTYIAGSLTNLDFKGPEAWEPLIVRADILDREPRADRAQAMLHVAIDRAFDPTLVPQDRPWTIEIYRALGAEFGSLNQLGNAIEVYEAMLKRWPTHSTAPDTQGAIAQAYDQAALLTKQGTDEHAIAARRALEARTKLARYIGNTDWVDANKDNPAALRNAERLVRSGLQRAATQHTNQARAALLDADATSDGHRQIDLLAHASAEYELAGVGWQGYLDTQRDDAAAGQDAYDSRYWNADARHKAVRIKVKLHELSPAKHAPPATKEIDDARKAATLVRDSNEDDKFLDNAAFFVVDLADVDRDLAYMRHRQSKGAGGVERRDDVSFEATPPLGRPPRPLEAPIPEVVAKSMAARDDYVRRVPSGRDPQKRAGAYRYWVAETYFLYGKWELARERFEALWRDHCATDAYGFKAWEKLLTMAARLHDEERALALAEAVDPKKGGTSCNAAGESIYTENVVVSTSFARARRRFDEACEAKGGSQCTNQEAPGKKAVWREAAMLYERAIDAGPESEDAPDGALKAAYAYRQIGELPKAIASYERLIAAHGSNERLDALQRQDPRRYAERAKQLGDAQAELGATYYGLFDYAKAALTYATLAEGPRFVRSADERRAAARNAMILYANLGEREKMLAAHGVLSRLGTSAAERADADHRVAMFGFRVWNAQRRVESDEKESGEGRKTRREAEATLARFFKAHRTTPGASRFLVEAAYAIATMKRVGGEPDHRVWLQETVTVWDELAKSSRADAQSAPYVDEAAEASFTLLDDEIAAKFDVRGRHAYPARVPEILGDGAAAKGRYTVVAEEAKAWDLRLEREIIGKYASPQWVASAIARQGTLFDALRTGLYDATKPKLFDANGERLIESMRKSGQQSLLDRADQLEDAAREVWRARKQKELDAADEVMVRRYASAVALARKHVVRTPLVVRAHARLAYFTDVLGDAKMRLYVTATPDPNTKGTTTLPYSDALYQTTRPGLAAR